LGPRGLKGDVGPVPDMEDFVQEIKDFVQGTSYSSGFLKLLANSYMYKVSVNEKLIKDHGSF